MAGSKLKSWKLAFVGLAYTTVMDDGDSVGYWIDKKICNDELEMHLVS